MASDRPQVPAPALDVQTYNAFVAGVQPTQVVLGDVSARADAIDWQEVQATVNSRFLVACAERDDQARTFSTEARLKMEFVADDGREVAHFSCLYRATYLSNEPLSDDLLDEFARRNAPVHVWPFMRELVQSLTQRFGWSGFLLPSFLIPASPDEPEREKPRPESDAAAAATKPTKAKAAPAKKPPKTRAKAPAKEQQ